MATKVAGEDVRGNNEVSGVRMEPSWTEPPPVTWVLIAAQKRASCRRRSDGMPENEGRSCRAWVWGCEWEHEAEGRRRMQSGDGSWTRGAQNDS